MADLKISQLISATVPLTGTEVLPIVQSNSTKKVATDDLTVKNVRSNVTTGILQIIGPAAASTRIATVPNANFTVARTDAAQSFTGDQTLGTGNLVQGTAAKGINFTANTATAGSTSRLLNWYEEGTWTPTITGSTTAGTATYSTQSGAYTKIGRQVTVTCRLTWSAANGTGVMQISGLPFTTTGITNQVAQILPISMGAGNTTYVMGYVAGSVTKIQLYKYAAGVASAISVEASGDLIMTMTYTAT